MLHLWLHLKSDIWIKWRDAQGGRGRGRGGSKSGRNGGVASGGGTTTSAVSSTPAFVHNVPPAAYSLPPPPSNAYQEPLQNKSSAGGGSGGGLGLSTDAGIFSAGGAGAVSGAGSGAGDSRPAAPARKLTGRVRSRQGTAVAKSGKGAASAGSGTAAAGGAGASKGRGALSYGGRAGGGTAAGPNRVKCVRYRLEGEQDRYLADWEAPARRALQVGGVGKLHFYWGGEGWMRHLVVRLTVFCKRRGVFSFRLL